MILRANVLAAWFGKQTYSLATDSTCTAKLKSFDLLVGIDYVHWAAILHELKSKF